VSLPKVALVTGVGPGTGSAIVRRFASGGYRVAMLARDRSRLDGLARATPGASAHPCDVTVEAELDATIASIRSTLGACPGRASRGGTESRSTSARNQTVAREADDGISCEKRLRA
jgi:NAD(P)-dependent dehydrogenase (short-subunit alcohol dehydrogenase family)